MNKEIKRVEKNIGWAKNQNLDAFFTTLEKINSAGVSSIITRQWKKEAHESNQGN